ncbi:AMP-binding protein [Amycolatopsis sp. CA-230715]|uniref:AMP-binding protein n=1 Tax=Amycolatopsis sp. CA-230715 TaxID=2745196 RepID=UPI001C00C0A8|nr:AMP-binding protein [Amycolatopsis sp. CA-230715]QWF84779.1 Long-chain-fatty-acid--CoA ligase FadD13 [Amycolatopsis sp. CA-230715]
MAALLEPMAFARPDEPALDDGQEALTWAELDRAVNGCIALLRERGLGLGDRLALVTGNSRYTFQALLACLHSGITLVPVNWHLTADEIAYVFGDCVPAAVIADPGTAATVSAALARHPAAGTRLRAVSGAVAHGGLEPLDDLLRTADGTEPDGQVCGSMLLYTSGTSGHPKGVVSTLLHAGAPLDKVNSLLTRLGDSVGLPRTGRNLLTGPWYHSGQLFLSLFPMLGGCGLVVRPRFDPADLLSVIDEHRITTTHLVPTHFARLLRLPPEQRAAFDGGSLELVWHGGSPCPAKVKRDMIDWWGPVFTEYYASTEGGMVTTIDSETWLRKPASVGRTVGSAQVLIVGQDGAELPPGRHGKVYVRRRPGRGFRYHNAPEKTAKAHLRPDTYTFGDSGYLDDDGYLVLTGRDDDTIISGGVNIYPAEVEAALLSHPEVQDAAVFALPDEEFGQRVAAALQVHGTGIPPDLESHCRERLAGFKLPRSVWVVPKMPRDPNGKLRRALFRVSGPAPGEVSVAGVALGAPAPLGHRPDRTVHNGASPADAAR